MEKREKKEMTVKINDSTEVIFFVQQREKIKGTEEGFKPITKITKKLNEI